MGKAAREPHAMTHPTDDRLRAVAFGDLDITARLLVEAHLALCSECATTVALFGGAGDGLGEPEPIDLVVRPPEFDRIWARVEELAATAVLPQAAVLPASVLSVLPDPAGWRWIRAWPEKPRSALLMRDAETGSRLYLRYYPPRSRYPRHRHLGVEESVILAGGFQNGDVHVEAGDWVTGAPGTEHSPATGRDEECWCLSRVTPPGVSFAGLRGWLQLLRGLTRWWPGELA